MANSQEIHFPFKIEDVDLGTSQELVPEGTAGIVRVGPKKYIMTNLYKKEASNIYNMELRNDDIFVVTVPRSGTTWTQELVWMVANNLDYAKSDAIPLTRRYTFLEFSLFFDPVLMQKLTMENSDDKEKIKLLEVLTESGTKQLAKTPSPRFVKTHMPLSLLPPTLLDKTKVVYVARDPRDVAVSYFYLAQHTRAVNITDDFKTYWGEFLQGLHPSLPFFEHVKEAWEKRHHPNMLFLFYEELSKDLPAAVRRVSAFLDKEYNEEQIACLCEHLSFDNFKKNKSVNDDVFQAIGLFKSNKQNFIRKGKTGGWRDHFDEEMTQQAERWITDNLRGTDLRFPSMQN